MKIAYGKLNKNSSLFDIRVRISKYYFNQFVISMDFAIKYIGGFWFILVLKHKKPTKTTVQ